jgi:hypothetical protein
MQVHKSDSEPVRKGSEGPPSPAELRRRARMEMLQTPRFQSFVTQRAFLSAELMLRKTFEGHRIPVPHRTEPFDEVELQRSFRPELPTIGFTLSKGHKEMALVAAAAAKLRDEGNPICNVTFLPPTGVPQLFLRERGERFELMARRGIVVEANGDWREGSFAKPIRIDLVGTFGGVNNLLLERIERLGIPFVNSSSALQIGRDKRLNKGTLEKLAIATPASVVIDHDTAPNAVRQIIDDFVAGHELAEVVVKPVAGSHGDGVRFYPSTKLEEIVNATRDLLAADVPAVLIEERIPSFPVHSSQGFRQDWNIRLLVGMGGVIDWEARVRRWGGVVNKDKGAKIEEVSEVLKRAATLSSEDSHAIQARAEEIGLSIAKELRAGFIGVDLILGPDRTLYVIEINCGAVGGMKSLTEIRPPESRFDAQRKFLSQLLRHDALEKFRPDPEARRPGTKTGRSIPVTDDPFTDPQLCRELNRSLKRFAMRNSDTLQKRSRGT